VTKMLEIRMARCVLYLTESELQRLLSREPDLWKLAIGRGKGIARAKQTRERVTRKVETERRPD
jgi:hypothetical protein